MQSLFEVIM